MQRSYIKSRALYERASRVLAGGVSSEFRKFSQPHPLFYTHGAGSRVWDADGNELLDFTLSQGPLILGHSHPEVLDAVMRASTKGQLYAGQYLEEVELAERLQRLIPCAELLRFSLSGSEAVQAAIRVAREATGRPRFLRFEGHYHGWLDNMCYGVSGLSKEALGERTSPVPISWSGGLPSQGSSELLLLPWNDLALVDRVLAEHHSEIAAIITEPIMCNSGCIPAVSGFLEGLRQLCDRYGAALIFDEVITGFRMHLGGAQSALDVTPDLAIFGKAMANGYPISALAGRRDWMDLIAESRVIHAGTMNSGCATVAAATATVKILERDAVPTRLAEMGKLLMGRLRDAADATGHTVALQGPGPMFHLAFTRQRAARDYRDTFRFDKAKYASFCLEMQERGIRLIGRGLWYVSAAHTLEDIDQCASAAVASMHALHSSS